MYLATPSQMKAEKPANNRVIEKNGASPKVEEDTAA